METHRIQCHYEILGVERDADSATIKKRHRKMALQHHPDKNPGDDQAAEKFRLVQQAYEVLSDPQERKWYDDHREAILAGWSASTSSAADGSVEMIFNVVPFMHPGCYSGYNNDMGGFFQVYRNVFENIVAFERKQSEITVELPTDFGDANAEWEMVRIFYQSWESFSSALNFSWEDKYNVFEDAPNRTIRRMMEDDNKKARKSAKKAYNSDILQLVSFVKRRDPRVKAKMAEKEKHKREQEARQKKEMMERKQEQQKAKEAWRENALREMELAEEQDRLAGRVRLADLEDDYDYGGGKKKKGKKKKNKQLQVEEEETDDTDVNNEEDLQITPEKETVGGTIEDGRNGEGQIDENNIDTAEKLQEDVVEQIEGTNNDIGDESYDESESEEEEEEPDIWRCECCRKDFKSEGQMENHMKSKKHKEAFKKFQAKLKKKEEELMAEMMDEMEIQN
mmetsp:Transcript_12829/g.23986  ORF Transcript_12829/g.23986 Transcript_12829/m.23986 type:complete len:452 (-) Transcript_12829:796-2151(-)